MKPSTFVLVSALIICFAATNLDATTAPSAAEKKVGACRFQEFGAANALRKISKCANVPIGVISTFDHKTEPTVVIDFPGGTVSQLLAIFTSQAPEYSWSITKSGVIHFIKRDSHLDLPGVVLSFPGANGQTRKKIWEDLINRPEIEDWLSANHCSPQSITDGSGFGSNNGPVFVPAGPITLVELFDSVILQSGNNFWSITRSSADKPCWVSIFLM